MKKYFSLVLMLTMMSTGLIGCSRNIIPSHENDYVYSSNPPMVPVSKIPPGSLLSQRIAH
jgi:hypothetical protein